MDISNYSGKFFTSNDVTSAYLTDIRKHKAPTVEEEEQLFARLKDGDESAKAEIITRNQRFVFSLAKIYAKNSSEVMDYVEEGNIGLIEAVDKFEPERGFKFITFAVAYIRREMNYYLNNTNNSVRKSNNMKLSKKIDTVKQEFYKENMYYPSIEETIELIDKKYGIKIRNRSDVFDMNISSISDTIGDDGSTYEEEGEFSRVTASISEYEEVTENEYNTSLIDKVFSILPGRQGDIVRMAYGIGYDREYTPEEIGMKYDLSEEDVIRIKNKTIAYLRQEKKHSRIAF